MRTRAAVLIAAACLVGGQASVQAQQKTKTPAPERSGIAPKAQQVLHDMSAFLAKQKALEVDVDGTTDSFDEKNQKIELTRKGHVAIERPNKLRSDRKGDLADAQIFYDGKTLTVFAKNANAYAQRPVPGTIDSMVDTVYDKFGMDLGPGDILSSNPEKTLTEDAIKGMDLGLDNINDVKTRHISVQGREVDWELWVQEGDKPLPLKYVITSKRVEGSPKYSVTLSNWKLVDDLPDDTFTFTPPKDAKKIQFVDQVKATKKIKPTKKE